jgi:hypothetical protein
MQLQSKPRYGEAVIRAPPGQTALLEVANTDSECIVSANTNIDKGYLYFEVKLITAGDMRIGWCGYRCHYFYNGFKCQKESSYTGE